MKPAGLPERFNIWKKWLDGAAISSVTIGQIKVPAMSRG
jgi:hypothetical protein